jgi:hypothetical protein
MIKHTVQFTAEALAPLALFVAKSDIRYYLCGLSVIKHPTDQGVLIQATNGAAIAFWHDKNGFVDEPRIFEITPALVNAAKKAGKGLLAANTNITLLDGRLCLVVLDQDGEVQKELHIQAGSPVIDAKYPDTRKLFPENSNLISGIAPLINADFLALCVKASCILKGKLFAGLRFYCDKSTPEGKTVVMIDGMSEFMAMIMPMRDGGVTMPPLPVHFDLKEKESKE